MLIPVVYLAGVPSPSDPITALCALTVDEAPDNVGHAADRHCIARLVLYVVFETAWSLR